jgi:hypothetical protein
MVRKATRKLTRRDAVALLGAGTVMSTVRTVSASGEEPRQNEAACSRDAVVATYKSPNGHALLSYSCCNETLNAVLVGVAERGRVPTSRGKTHLKKLRDELLTANLEEYCFMIWGLKGDQATSLLKSVPTQLGLDPTTLSKPPK